MTVPKPFSTTPHAVAEAMSALGRDVVAGILGVSVGQLYKGCNPNQPCGLGFLAWDKVKMLSALLRAKGKPDYFAAAFDTEVGYLAEEMTEAAPGSLEHAVVMMTAKVAQVSVNLADITAPDSDGGAVITPAEAVGSVQHLDEAIKSLTAMKRRVMAEARSSEAGR